MRFRINNKLRFMDSFQLVSVSLDRIVENLNKDDLIYLSQEFDNNVLDILMQNVFHPHDYMSDF